MDFNPISRRGSKQIADMLKSKIFNIPPAGGAIMINQRFIANSSETILPEGSSDNRAPCVVTAKLRLFGDSNWISDHNLNTLLSFQLILIITILHNNRGIFASAKIERLRGNIDFLNHISL
jgi:hypothetical protein